ncbi:MAG TPA: class I SAM-dependent methyltransferase, partial [Chitinophagaceae bacterium]|nr:class I SAM-dependent methyltransferase [Chitinophagaceae bacterium]
KKFLQHQSFQPGFISLFINPFYLIRRRLFRHIRKLAPALQGKLLDFGCGRKPYENLFRVTEYIGVDIETTGHDHSNSRVDVYYNGRHIPFNDATFDSLFCSEVLEHIFNPDEILTELNRVLKPGAHALFTVPFCWNEHEVPFDYARYSSFGFAHLLKKNGFEVIELWKSGTFTQVVFQLWALYFFELFRKWGRTGYAISLLFIAPINLAGAVFTRIFPRNHSLYFNNIVLARKPGEA